MNIMNQNNLNINQLLPYCYYPTQPSTIENIPSYHSTSELPDQNKDKDSDQQQQQQQQQNNIQGQQNQQQQQQQQQQFPNFQNLNNNNINSQQNFQPNIPIKVEQQLQQQFNNDNNNGNNSQQVSQTNIQQQQQQQQDPNNVFANQNLIQQYCLPFLNIPPQMYQIDLFFQEYQNPQLSNFQDMSQKLNYNKQLVNSISTELDRAENKLNIPVQQLSQYYDLFFKKKGNAFSEKFSKPRPMSYKQQNQQKESILLKKEQQNQKNSSSKFHNMTKLLMYTFLQMFSQENLESLGLPDYIQHHLKKLAKNIKLSGKKPKGPHNVIKTDCFNHAHYNALFLILTPENIKELSKYEREIEVHSTCYDIDLTQKPIDKQKINYVNIIKSFTYLVVKNSIGELVVENTSNTRTEYLQRAMVGINKLNMGNMIQRF